MIGKLALIGNTSLASPLLFLDTLPDRIVIHVHIEGLAQTDPLPISDSFLDPSRLIDLSQLQWHVLLFRQELGS